MEACIKARVCPPRFCNIQVRVPPHLCVCVVCVSRHGPEESGCGDELCDAIRVELCADHNNETRCLGRVPTLEEVGEDARSATLANQRPGELLQAEFAAIRETLSAVKVRLCLTYPWGVAHHDVAG